MERIRRCVRPVLLGVLALVLTGALLSCGGGGSAGGGRYELRWVNGAPMAMVYGTRYRVDLYRVDGPVETLVVDAWIAAGASSGGPMYTENNNGVHTIYSLYPGLTLGTVEARLTQGSPVVSAVAFRCEKGATFRCDVNASVNGLPADGARIGFRFTNGLVLDHVTLGSSGSLSRDLPQNADVIRIRELVTSGPTYDRAVVNGTVYDLPGEVPISVQPAGGLITYTVLFEIAP